MAFIPYFAFGPTSFLGLVGLLHGPDPTVPTPQEEWSTKTVDLLIPTFNEAQTILFCLSAIERQTLKPRHILLYDDGSSDQTIAYAKAYAKLANLKLKIVRRDKSEGKTASICYMVQHSDADVLVVVDGDTLLRSDNYIERIVQELFQGVGIACACGTVLPLTEADRKKEVVVNHLHKFSSAYPEVPLSPDTSWLQLFQRNITNNYREELYLFLQRFIYRGEMVFFGSLIFPIGCAVAYRRDYLKHVLDHFIPIFGYDLTTSEDIFFGFAFAEMGYRNINVPDVVTLTMEPRFPGLYKQIFFWSSSFLQSCYYFDSIFFTPFHSVRYWIKKFKDKHNPELQQMIEKRKIKEAYRQPFGVEYTLKYGRNIGWFVFTTACEKLSYPTFLIMSIAFGWWEVLEITLGAEVTLYTLLIASMYKGSRLKNLCKAILYTPIRYSQVLFELVVIGRFMIDLWVTRNRRWRK